ncbi:hypothetical protein FNV43_RR11938 [Rhamnella rubrinervis]|uniref:Uncharacterized protein n=1 Tax=Rhamnella rubrinervis TaxID=2594499 RepID=A0A8K0H7D1_9ROSA|nr:hypothetical protein FNV43_RR11938 [Rhamnella rubrinervis]
MKQRSRIGPEVQVTSDADVAVSLKVLEIEKSGGVTRLGSGNEPEEFLEKRFVARNGERTLVGEAVFFFGLDKKVLEDGVVQVRRADNESSATPTDADGHVSGGDIGRYAGCGHSGLVAPAPQQLSEPHNVADLAAFSDSS